MRNGYTTPYQPVNPPHNRLHLIIPGFLGPLGRLEEAGIEPRTPILDNLLAKADRSEVGGDDYLSTLFGLFGYSAPQGADWPSAALCRLAEGGEVDAGYWLHADPVLLKPDMDRLLLFDGRSLEISPEEAGGLREQILGHFSDQDWRLEQAAPERWYLRLPDTPALATHPLHRVAGRNLFPFLPEGADRGRWRGLLNEIQMLLHHADINQARRAAGRPEVNGLWLWGGGRSPVAADSGWQRVYADHPLAAGLARHAGVELHTPSEHLDQAGIEGECLMYRDDLLQPLLDADSAAWSRNLERLEPLLETLSDALRQSRIEALLIYPCNGHSYCVTRSGLRRFWRRRKSITALLDGPDQ